MKQELDEVLCRLISLESGEDASESFLASISRRHESESEETDEEEEAEPMKHSTPARAPSRVQVGGLGPWVYELLNRHKKKDTVIMNVIVS